MLIQKKEVNSHIYLLLSHCYLLHKVIIFRFLFSHNRFVQLLQMGCGLCVSVPCGHGIRQFIFLHHHLCHIL